MSNQNNYENHFSRNLKRILNEKQMTSKQLSDLTSIATSQISQWLTCKRYPGPKNIERISNALGVAPFELTEAPEEVLIADRIFGDKIREMDKKEAQLVKKFDVYFNNRDFLEYFGRHTVFPERIIDNIKVITFLQDDDSMNLLFPKDSLLFIIPKDYYMNGDVVFFQYRGKGYVRQYQLGTTTKAVPQSTNSRYLEMDITHQFITGLVVWYCSASDLNLK